MLVAIAAVPRIAASTVTSPKGSAHTDGTTWTQARDAQGFEVVAVDMTTP